MHLPEFGGRQQRLWVALTAFHLLARAASGRLQVVNDDHGDPFGVSGG